MSKKKTTGVASNGRKSTAVAAAEASAVKNDGFDPILASLFATSTGPLVPATRSKREIVGDGKSGRRRTDDRNVEIAAAEEGADNDSESESSDSGQTEEEQEDTLTARPRKRRKVGQNEDLEAAYLDRLAREGQKEVSERLKAEKKTQDLSTAGGHAETAGMDDDDDALSSASNDLEDLSDLEDSRKDEAIPQHESLTGVTADYEKTRRTVFLGNVSIETITSKSARKTLENHLKSTLDSESKESIESLRFRSTAFDVSAGPKKAAYAKKELMDETTKSTNAYVVFTTEFAARKVARKLNGTAILDRHLRADWLAHPMAIDNKRCVFVGNLNFVDLESNIDANEDGEKQKRRPKAKVPADAEEGLWRAFSKCGTVESVRVVRDQATRVGKGFAYVQFSDEVGVEKALAMDGKKFPPMLPRTLRVSRAKRILKKDLKRKREETATRGRSGQARHGRSLPKGGQQGRALDKSVVFEGYRASSEKGMKFKTKGKKKKPSAKPTSRSSKRGAAFKAGGGKKKRDAN